MDSVEIIPAASGSPDYFSVDAMARRYIESYPSENTRKALRTDLNAHNVRGAMSYFDWCDAAGVHPLEVQRRQVPAWVRYLHDLGLSPASQQRKIATVRCFYRHVVDVEEQLEVNPVPDRNKHLHLPPVPRESQTRALSVDEYTAMLGAAESAGMWRDAAMLTTLLYQGLRSAELRALDQESLIWDQGKQVIRVLGKGGKVRMLPVVAPVTSAIEHMLTSKRVPMSAVLVAHSGASRVRPLFVDRHDERLTRSQVAYVVQRWAEAGGVKGAVTPHCFRHTATTLMLDAGVPLREVQRFMGHSSSSVTERYDARRGQLEGSSVEALEALVAKRMSKTPSSA